MKAKLLAMLCALAVLAGACSFTFREASAYEVNSDGLGGVNATIYEKATNQIAVLYDAICKRNIGCTVTFINNNVTISGWGATQWHNALKNTQPLEWNIQNLIYQGVLDNWNVGGPCLVLNVWEHPELWPLGWTEHYDWKSFGAGGSCKVGEALVQ